MTTNTDTLVNSVGLSNFYSKPPGSMKRRPTIEKITPVLTAMQSDHEGEGMVLYPRLKHFSHFHYDHIDFECLLVGMEPDGGDDDDEFYSVRVEVTGRIWVVYRAFDNFVVLDRQLHTCVFDREFSKLTDLQGYKPSSIEEMSKTVTSYLDRVSELSSQYQFYCGTVLNFFEVDSRGNRLMGADDCSAINIPAIAAAHVVKKYVSQAPDELSLEIGDMVSVIDKPRPEESTWWRGKKRFEVGFFPSDYVEIIGSGGSSHVTSTAADTKPVLKRRGKLISFLRVFFSNRPNRTTLKQSGIVKERIFGCDLGEHLSVCSLHVPYVLKCCMEAIEQHGTIDGIYRLSGVVSNIQRLRAEFDEGTVETLMNEELLDLHTITAVMKMYFRELPNPLLTYQLYDSFSEAVESKGDERLLKIRNVLKILPPPHYRTAKFLFAHLHKMSTYSNKTGMDTRNLAIVWSPNLMRSKVIEGANVTGPQMLASISIQATVIEAMISCYEYLFDNDTVIFRSESSSGKSVRPKSAIDSSTPSSNKLLTLAEAQERATSGGAGFRVDKRPGTSLRESENGSVLIPSYRSSGSDEMLSVFRTVIDFDTKKSDPPKQIRDSEGSNSGSSVRTSSGGASADAVFMRERSPSRWKSFFHRNKHNSGSKHTKNTDIELWIVDGNPTEHAGGEDITENEIGHLSRPLTLSTGNINEASSDDQETPITGSIKGRHHLRLTSPTTGQIHEDPSAPVDEDPSAPLMRAASHESFFEAPFSEPCVPPSPPAEVPSPDYATLTPGVTFKKGYTKPIGELLEKPKVTWKEARPLAHVPALGSQVLYLPRAAGSEVGSQLTLVTNHGAAAAESWPRSLSFNHRSAERQREEEHIYEPVGLYLPSAPTPGVLPVEEPLAITSITASQPPPLPPPISTALAKDFPKHFNHEQQPPVSPSAAGTLSSVKTNSSSGSSSSGSSRRLVNMSNVYLGIEELQREWEQSDDVIQCVNQGEQVSLSRSFSSNSSEPRSSRISQRRTFSDSIPEVDPADQVDYPGVTPAGKVHQPAGTDADPVYANIDPLGIKAQQPLSVHSESMGYVSVVPRDPSAGHIYINSSSLVTSPSSTLSSTTSTSAHTTINHTTDQDTHLLPSTSTTTPLSTITTTAITPALTATHTTAHTTTSTTAITTARTAAITPALTATHTTAHTTTSTTAITSARTTANTPVHTATHTTAHTTTSTTAITSARTTAHAESSPSAVRTSALTFVLTSAPTTHFSTTSASTTSSSSAQPSVHSAVRASVPTSDSHHYQNISVRPRAYTAPYKMPTSFRRKETNIDVAIADASPSSDTAKQHGRRPTRRMEYVNMRSYEADQRRVSRTLSMTDDYSNTAESPPDSPNSTAIAGSLSLSELSMNGSGKNSGGGLGVESVNSKWLPPTQLSVRQRVTPPHTPLSPFSAAHPPSGCSRAAESSTSGSFDSTPPSSPARVDPFSIFEVQAKILPAVSSPPVAAPRKSLGTFSGTDTKRQPAPPDKSATHASQRSSNGEPTSEGVDNTSTTYSTHL